MAGALIKSGLVERFRKEKKIKIFDPFCGSGTILLEALSLSIEKSIRKDFQNFDIFKKLRIFEKVT